MFTLSFYKNGYKEGVENKAVVMAWRYEVVPFHSAAGIINTINAYIDQDNHTSYVSYELNGPPVIAGQLGQEQPANTNYNECFITNELGKTIDRFSFVRSGSASSASANRIDL